jgi:hypothetical protein
MYLSQAYPALLTFNVILLASPDTDEPATEGAVSIGVDTSESIAARFTGISGF